MKFYCCENCHSILTFVKEENGLTCCGKPLTELVPNSFDASMEKHIPVLERIDNHVIAKVGNIPHPMIPEHYIEWVILETTRGYQLKNLKPNDAPIAEFILTKDEEILTAYAYCNIHKLWKS